MCRVVGRLDTVRLNVRVELTDGLVDLKISSLNLPVRLYAGFQAVHELICCTYHLIDAFVITLYEVFCELQPRTQDGDDYPVCAGAVHLPLNLVIVIYGDFVGTGRTPPGGVRCSLDLDKRRNMVIGAVYCEAVRGSGVAGADPPPAPATVADAQLWVSVCEPPGDRFL